MGSGGAKTTNQMLGNQTNLANQVGATAGNRSAENYAKSNSNTDYLINALKGDIAGLGTGGGGGGGASYTPASFDSSSLPFYMKLMNEGAYSPTERGAIESSATSPLSGIFEGLKRQLANRSTSSYGSGMSKLSRDAAYGASDASKGAFADIAKMVAESKERGAGGVTGIESEKRAFDAAERARALSASRSGGGDDTFREKMAMYSMLGGLSPDYRADTSQQLQGLGLGSQNIGARVSETPLWQKSLASIAPQAASAAVGAFMPTSLPGMAKKAINYGNLRGEGGAF